MWEDVRRCEKMWRREDVKMRRWGEDVRMRRCEDEKIWRWEDVKMRRSEDEKMWGWEDVKIRRCFTEPHYWKNLALRRSREKHPRGEKKPSKKSKKTKKQFSRGPGNGKGNARVSEYCFFWFSRGFLCFALFCYRGPLENWVYFFLWFSRVFVVWIWTKSTFVKWLVHASKNKC